MSFWIFIFYSSSLPVTAFPSPPHQRISDLSFVFFLCSAFSIFSPSSRLLHIFVFFFSQMVELRCRGVLSSSGVRYSHAVARLLYAKSYFFIYPQHCHQILSSLLYLSLHFFSHSNFAVIFSPGYVYDWLTEMRTPFYHILSCALFSRWKTLRCDRNAHRKKEEWLTPTERNAVNFLLLFFFSSCADGDGCVIASEWVQVIFYFTKEFHRRGTMRRKRFSRQHKFSTKSNEIMINQVFCFEMVSSRCFRIYSHFGKHHQWTNKI